MGTITMRPLERVEWDGLQGLGKLHEKDPAPWSYRKDKRWAAVGRDDEDRITVLVERYDLLLTKRVLDEHEATRYARWVVEKPRSVEELEAYGFWQEGGEDLYWQEEEAGTQPPDNYEPYPYGEAEDARP